MQEMWVRSLGQEDPPEKEMATHSSILAWEIPRTEEPGGLQSTGWQRVGQDSETEQQQVLWTRGPGTGGNVLKENGDDPSASSGRLDLGRALVETENSETDSIRSIWTPTFLWQFLGAYTYMHAC